MMYTRNTIEMAYTNVVADYLKRGYVINTKTSSGSQGEVHKIDFRDGSDVYRIVLLHIQDYDAPDNIGQMIIRVLKYTDVNMHTDILWTDKGTTIAETIFYLVAERCNEHKEVYSTDIEVAKNAERIRIERCRRKAYTPIRFIKFTKAQQKVVKEILKNHAGYKTVAATKIMSMRRTSNGYVIFIKDKDSVYIR